jgi:hypothetical protein
MPLYEYRCPTCRSTLTTTTRGDRFDASCARCGDPGPHVRVFSIRIEKPMQEHFNVSTGAPVSSMRQFREQLKIKGEEYTAQTGIEVNYQPVDVSDSRSLGVTSAGIEDKLDRTGISVD